MDPKPFEDLLKNIRVERLRLRTEFQKSNNIRLSIENKRHKEKVTKQMELLGKDILAIDKRFESANKRLQDIQVLCNQVRHISTLLAESDDE